MRDGRTRRVEMDDASPDFLDAHRVSLTLLNGPAAGAEFVLDGRRHLVGRGDAAAVRLDDRSVSSEHAAIELAPDGYGIRDLASTNGVLVNGAVVDVSALKHGDRITIGTCELQYIVESRSEARQWQLDID